MEHYSDRNDQSASSPHYAVTVECPPASRPQAGPLPNCCEQSFRTIDDPQRECSTAPPPLEGALVVDLGEIASSIVHSYAGGVSEGTQERLLNYVRLLASARKTDEQLVALGTAYLREILDPDRRYSGC